MEAQKRPLKKKRLLLNSLLMLISISRVLSGDLKDLTSEIYHAVMQKSRTDYLSIYGSFKRKCMNCISFLRAFPHRYEDLPSELYQSIMEQIKDRLPSGLPVFPIGDGRIL